jgi:Uma2 family endonuclease
MGVMAAEPKQQRAWEELPRVPEPLGNLRDLRDRIDTGHHKAEIINGELIVSQVAVFWHERVCQWLLLRFLEACTANGWFGDSAGEIELPPTGDLVEPDFMILRDASTVPDLEWTRPLDHVLLAAEVISASSIERDRKVKPQACALAGIPLYLLVDRFTKPVTISLYSEPGKDGYADVTTVTAGEKLRLPPRSTSRSTPHPCRSPPDVRQPAAQGRKARTVRCGQIASILMGIIDMIAGRCHPQA